MDNIKNMNKEKVFTKEAELTKRITDLIYEYEGELSLVAVMGILTLKNIELFCNQDN